MAKNVGPYLLTAEMNRFSIPPKKFPAFEFRNGMLRPINDATMSPTTIKIIDVTPLAAATPNINPSTNSNGTDYDESQRSEIQFSITIKVLCVVIN